MEEQNSYSNAMLSHRVKSRLMNSGGKGKYRMEIRTAENFNGINNGQNIKNSHVKTDSPTSVNTTDVFTASKEEETLPPIFQKIKLKSDLQLLRLAKCEMEDYYKGVTSRNPLKVKNSYCQHYAKDHPEFVKSHGNLTAPSEIRGKVVRYGIPAVALGGLFAAGILSGGLALGLFGVTAALNLGEDFLSTR